MTNMQKYAPPTLLMVPCRCKWAWVWLGWLRLLACWGYSAVAPSVAEAMEAGSVPALDKHQAYLFTQSDSESVGVAPVLKRSGPQITNKGSYPWLSQFIWQYPWLISKVIPFSAGQWSFEGDLGESRDLQPLRGSQARRWMKRMVQLPLRGYPRITQSRIIILTYPGLCTGKSGFCIPSYPGMICKSRNLTYPG